MFLSFNSLHLEFIQVFLYSNTGWQPSYCELLCCVNSSCFQFFSIVVVMIVLRKGLPMEARLALYSLCNPDLELLLQSWLSSLRTAIVYMCHHTYLFVFIIKSPLCLLPTNLSFQFQIQEWDSWIMWQACHAKNLCSHKFPSVIYPMVCCLLCISLLI